ncbi:hypothetical protein AVEN_193325-1 [Araneus ventricosus]|uniref:Uncharacterized protein n=1 Tax=Araneus ventricosus TaxID=182803 RepID=A0A4Y1ZQ12_ARAVE|nr:hypothetical protein AVEN_193325-1 [Araneus ventricosus]
MCDNILVKRFVFELIVRWNVENLHKGKRKMGAHILFKFSRPPTVVIPIYCEVAFFLCRVCLDESIHKAPDPRSDKPQISSAVCRHGNRQDQRNVFLWSWGTGRFDVARGLVKARTHDRIIPELLAS